jgi:hypothetical protein
MNKNLVRKNRVRDEWHLLKHFIPSPLMGEGYAYMDVGVRATQDAKAEGGGEMVAITQRFHPPPRPLPSREGGSDAQNRLK